MRRALILFLACCAVAGCRDPRAEANIAQAMMEVGTAISTMQQDYGLLQTQLDSLREVVARQDTLISRLASHVGMPLPQR